MSAIDETFAPCGTPAVFSCKAWVFLSADARRNLFSAIGLYITDEETGGSGD